MMKAAVDEALMIELNAKEYPLREIGRRLSVSKGTVAARLTALGVPRRSKADAGRLGFYKFRQRQLGLPIPTESELEQRDRRAVELYQGGLSANRTGDEIGCSGQTVLNILERAGVPRREISDARASSKSRYRTRLDERGVWELRLVAVVCRNWTKLGRMFRISPATAQRAVTGESWKHVPFPTIDELAQEAA